MSIAARRADFQALHNEGHFLLRTAWDVGSARQLEDLGYAGLATTLRSLAWVHGCAAKDLTCNDVLTHMRRLVNATEIPVNADFGFGFATNDDELSDNVHMAIDTGIAALSIGNRFGDELFPLSQAVAQVRACRRAIDTSGADVVLVARADVPSVGIWSLSTTIERLVALSNAGADVLCVPSMTNPAAIKATVLAVAPKSLDIQLTQPGITTVELGQLRVRRISVGDFFAQAAWAGFMRAAREFIDCGDLASGSRSDAAILR